MIKTLVNYFSLCIFGNFVITSICFMINAKNSLSEFLSELITVIVITNIVKIFNQLIILKDIRRRCIIIKNLLFDKVLDFIKFCMSIFVICNYTEFCINKHLLFFFVLLCCNFIIIIIQFIINLIKPNLFIINYQNETLINNNNNDNNIYINIIQHQNMTDYTAKNSNLICAICLDEQTETEIWSKLLCTHEFHKKCIADWLQRDNTCPTCRHLIN